MTQKVQEFKRRMRHDRIFRHRILAARKAGTLPEILAQEGYEIDLNMLVAHLPKVRTGIIAGADDSSSSCYCLI